VSLELRRDLSRVIRQVRPQRVLGQSPERNYARIFASHPDHLAAGEATLCAVYPDARNAFTFTELLDEGHEPWTVSEVWLMASPRADHAVDVTDHVEQKIRALLRHESQHPDPVAMEQRVRGWLTRTADEHGLPAGRAAEVFQVVPTA
jgi:LmbE family N-acetylglucosaminyl deacetylase